MDMARLFLVFLAPRQTHHNFPFQELNTLEIRPPNMDDSGRIKYPVLFRV